MIETTTKSSIQNKQSLRAIYSYNSALSYLLRGELDKTKAIMDSLWNKRFDLPMMVQKIMMGKIYVMLKSKQDKECADFIKQNCILFTFRKCT